MLSIGTIITALSTIASAVDRIQERTKTKRETEQSKSLVQKLKDLEEADLEQEMLIREVSTNVEDLAKAIETEIEKNRERDARTRRLVYAALALGLVALGTAIAALVR